MKIINGGQVYDLDYGKSDRVCSLPTEEHANGVGNHGSVTVELRRDKTTGMFYVLKSTGGYDRSSYRIVPTTADEAKRIAEDFLDYDAYVKVFGDPEGPARELERKLEETLERLKNANESSDTWYNECQRLKAKVVEIEKLAEKAKEAQ